ncbi:MAG: hypothetical protein B6U69_01955 [Thermofilum sp. ex4484_15]|nr:MAG: hypothetical protein B6U69_01955 [Thermofilum sp. ex4484_15]
MKKIALLVGIVGLLLAVNAVSAIPPSVISTTVTGRNLKVDLTQALTVRNPVAPVILQSYIAGRQVDLRQRTFISYKKCYKYTYLSNIAKVKGRYVESGLSATMWKWFTLGQLVRAYEIKGWSTARIKQFLFSTTGVWEALDLKIKATPCTHDSFAFQQGIQLRHCPACPPRGSIFHEITNYGLTGGSMSAYKIHFFMNTYVPHIHAYVNLKAKDWPAYFHGLYNFNW